MARNEPSRLPSEEEKAFQFPDRPNARSRSGEFVAGVHSAHTPFPDSDESDPDTWSNYDRNRYLSD